MRKYEGWASVAGSNSVRKGRIPCRRRVLALALAAFSSGHACRASATVVETSREAETDPRPEILLRASVGSRMTLLKIENGEAGNVTQAGFEASLGRTLWRGFVAEALYEAYPSGATLLFDGLGLAMRYDLALRRAIENHTVAITSRPAVVPWLRLSLVSESFDLRSTRKEDPQALLTATADLRGRNILPVAAFGCDLQLVGSVAASASVNLRSSLGSASDVAYRAFGFFVGLSMRN